MITPEDFMAAFKNIIDTHPLPQPPKEEVGKVLFARREEFRIIIKSMSLDEIRALAQLPHFPRISSTVTRAIIEELLDRLEEE